MPGKPEVQVEAAEDGFNLAPGGVIVTGGQVAGRIHYFADAAEVVGAVSVGAGFGAGHDFHALREEAFFNGFAVGAAALLGDGGPSQR